MNPEQIVRASKFLSLILRHKPETIGVTLDPEGWTDIDELVAKSKGRLTRELVFAAVRDNDKQRFAVSDDDRRIRALQGHSLDVDLKLEPKTPPDVLYHGTYQKAVAAIQREGLKKMQRQHVHMAADLHTASSVGMRRGAPVIYKVLAMRMHEAGFLFYQSENGVWLTNHVPPEYLQVQHG